MSAAMTRTSTRRQDIEIYYSFAGKCGLLLGIMPDPIRHNGQVPDRNGKNFFTLLRFVIINKRRGLIRMIGAEELMKNATHECGPGSVVYGVKQAVVGKRNLTACLAATTRTSSAVHHPVGNGNVPFRFPRGTTKLLKSPPKNSW